MRRETNAGRSGFYNTSSTQNNGDDALEREIGRNRERIMYARPRRDAPPDPDNPAEDSAAVREGRISPFAQNRRIADAPRPSGERRARPAEPAPQADAFFETLRDFSTSPDVQRYLRSVARLAADAARRVAQNLDTAGAPRRRPTVDVYEDDVPDEAEAAQDRRDLAEQIRERVRRSQAAGTSPADATLGGDVPPRRQSRKIDIDDVSAI